MVRCSNCGWANPGGLMRCEKCNDSLTFDVFISYSRKDYVDDVGNVIPNNMLSRIKHTLKANGISYWFDGDSIYSGDVFAREIAKSIKNSKLFLFISSVHTNTSEWICSEIEIAKMYKKKILPVKIDTSVYNDSVITYITNLDFIDLTRNQAQGLLEMTKCIMNSLNNIESIISPQIKVNIKDALPGMSSRIARNDDGVNSKSFHSSLNRIVNQDRNESNDSDEQGKKYEYDVFLSSKSEDYPLAEEVYEFLRRNGLTAFAASKELDRIGEAEYADAIDAALDATTHMIVIASSIDNLKSEWVHYEWSTFRNDLKSGYRKGNLLTILAGISPRDLPAGLRHQQSFNFDSFKNGRILGYLKHKTVSAEESKTKKECELYVALIKPESILMGENLRVQAFLLENNKNDVILNNCITNISKEIIENPKLCDRHIISYKFRKGDAIDFCFEIIGGISDKTNETKTITYGYSIPFCVFNYQVPDTISTKTLACRVVVFANKRPVDETNFKVEVIRSV